MSKEQHFLSEYEIQYTFRGLGFRIEGLGFKDVNNLGMTWKHEAQAAA